MGARNMLHRQARWSDGALQDHARRQPLKREGNVRKWRRTFICVTASSTFSICCQAARRLTQFRQGEIGGDAQVTAGESSSLAPIGSPVPPTALIASACFVRGKGSLLAGKRESGRCFQPGVPGRGIEQHDHVLPLLLVYQTAVANCSGG
ncbi:hypothetical protein [Dictyobacter arantiisoli]|uniref:hypothetical protein n=1 Tax=Dictyobacter arantiisoli TaxID=2014874 RepID=UPI001F2BF1CD|nr:hypothetical protein [Dictyobacter arantiisoli]